METTGNLTRWFSYISPEQRVPSDHPLRAIRIVVDGVLPEMSGEFDRLYADVGRPSIPPERLLRANKRPLQRVHSVSSTFIVFNNLGNLLFAQGDLQAGQQRRFCDRFATVARTLEASKPVRDHTDGCPDAIQLQARIEPSRVFRGLIP